MRVKREMSYEPDRKSEFISLMLSSGYLLYVSRDHQHLIFKRRGHYPSPLGAVPTVRKLNPVNFVHAHLRADKVTLVVRYPGMLFLILLLNLSIALLLYVAGMSTKSIVLLASLFTVMEILMMLFLINLSLDDICKKIGASALGK